MMQKCFGYRQPEKRAMLHRSEEHTSELQSPCNLVCRLLLEKKKLLAGIRPYLAADAWANATLADLLAALAASSCLSFFFNDTATTEIYTLSLHDALPIFRLPYGYPNFCSRVFALTSILYPRSEEHTSELQSPCNLVCRLLLEKKKPT